MVIVLPQELRIRPPTWTRRRCTPIDLFRAVATIEGVSPSLQELGIPTANLDAASLKGQLAEAVTGIYAGKCCETAAVKCMHDRRRPRGQLCLKTHVAARPAG